MGKVICIGLGPGNPELMSLRAYRLLSGARRIAYFRKAGNPGQARRMVEGYLARECEEWPMEYPVTTEIPVSDPRYNALLSAFYDDWAERLRIGTDDGDVIVLCEGDPFLYGSFMHLYTRLPTEMVEVVPGIPGMAGCWSASGQPITWGDDVLTIVPATLSEDELQTHIARTDALVVMKIGRNLEKVRRALIAHGRADQAWLVEHGTMPNERVRKLCEVTGPVPYFSIILIHGQGRRP